jgi:hypothetical protein
MCVGFHSSTQPTILSKFRAIHELPLLEFGLRISAQRILASSRHRPQMNLGLIAKVRFNELPDFSQSIEMDFCY